MTKDWTGGGSGYYSYDRRVGTFDRLTNIRRYAIFFKQKVCYIQGQLLGELKEKVWYTQKYVLSGYIVRRVFIKMLCKYTFRDKRTTMLYPKVCYKQVRYNEIILYFFTYKKNCRCNTWRIYHEKMIST